MDEKTAKLIAPKLEALHAFVNIVEIKGMGLQDYQTWCNYQAMYDDIKDVLNDPKLGIYSPPIPDRGSPGASTLSRYNQERIVLSGKTLIAYLQAKLAQHPSVKTRANQPLRCFLSFRFEETSSNYADLVRRFLELSGIEVVTGERFEPRSISEKIAELLTSDLNFGVLIVTRYGESMWTRDEVNRLWGEEKYVIILVEEGASFKQGLQADIEWIQFPEGHISDTYIKILEGISYIREKTGKL